MRERLSKNIKTATNNNNKADNCAAAKLLSIPNHVLNIPVVNADTPKY